MSLTVSEDSFRLWEGGSVYDPGVGSDRFSSTSYAMHRLRTVEGDSRIVTEWLEQARQLIDNGAHVSFETYPEDGIDWSEDLEDGAGDWSRRTR